MKLFTNIDGEKVKVALSKENGKPVIINNNGEAKSLEGWSKIPKWKFMLLYEPLVTIVPFVLLLFVITYPLVALAVAPVIYWFAYKTQVDIIKLIKWTLGLSFVATSVVIVLYLSGLLSISLTSTLLNSIMYGAFLVITWTLFIKEYQKYNNTMRYKKTLYFLWSEKE